jgi:hypothetical protein
VQVPIIRVQKTREGDVGRRSEKGEDEGHHLGS